MEAAGLVDLAGEGAQMMTKERKEEAVRREREFREKRRKYKAARLNVGVVVESYVVGEGGHVRTEAHRVEENNDDWRVLTPEELLQQVGQKNGNAQKRVPDDAVSMASVVGDVGGTFAGSKQEGGEHDGTTTSAKAEIVDKESSAKKSKKRKGTATDSGLHSNGAETGPKAADTANHCDVSNSNSKKKAKRSRHQTKQNDGDKENPNQAKAQAQKRKGNSKLTGLPVGQRKSPRGRERARVG